MSALQPEHRSFLQPLDTIAGVYVVTLTALGDARGRFMETFRREWFPWVNWDRLQTNRSESAAGVLRGLHYHHRQIDYWHVISGQIRVGLADLRSTSPTFRQSHALDLSADTYLGLFIPEGVAHGFVALTDALLSYTVNNYYDGSDELGVRWNDPVLNVPWGVTDPVLSQRDQTNPLLADIRPEHLPK